MGVRTSRDGPVAVHRSASDRNRRKYGDTKLIRLRPYLLLLLLSLIVYLPVMQHATGKRVDFGIHITFALGDPDSTGDLAHAVHVAHILFHAIFLFVDHLAPFLPPTSVAFVAILLVMLPVPIMAFALFKDAAGDTLPASNLIALSLAVTIATPITIWSNPVMIGYMNPIVYHNPTYITARLFVIPLSLLAFRIFLGQPYRDLNQRVYVLLLSAVVVLLGTMAKPSFTFALLPGCCLFALWRSFRRQPVDWLLLVCGICLPGMILMGLQYLIVYESADRGFRQLPFGLLTIYAGMDSDLARTHTVSLYR